MSTPPPRSSPRRALAVALALLALGACRGRSRTPAAAAPPSAEFLLSAGDSTYWVTSDAARIHVRSSAMFLARYGGRMYEVYAADDDRSFYDAVFTSQRIYRRDLVDGDSLPVYDDGVVPALARRYAAAHPHERPLGPEDETADQPRTSATTEVSLVDVHGPYLTYDARADIDVEGGATRHTARRTVVDLRTARSASLVQLFGAAAAESLVVEGQRQLGRALDSVRAIADSEEEAGARALHALPTFRFAADNFGLTVRGAAPAVAFVALGHDVDGHTVTLALPPIAVPGPAPDWWRADVADVLPTTLPDSSESRWTIGAHDVVARYLSDHESAQLLLRARVGGRMRDWSIGRMPTPVRQLFALDRPALGAGARRALARAFNESSLYGDQATSAAFHRERKRTAARAASCEARVAQQRKRGTERSDHRPPHALLRSCALVHLRSL